MRVRGVRVPPGPALAAGLVVSVGVGATAPVRAQDSVTVVAGDYAAGGVARFLLGSDYRDLWTTPVRVPLLDLRAYAGGLTPVRTGGFGQTISLHFDGADGRRYVFRSIDKDLSRRLAEGLRGTFVEDIVQDQTSSYHPAAALVTAALVEAVGVLAATPALRVMPDDPLLGEFREAYAGMVGMIMENPNEGPGDTPGFAGSTLIVGSDRMLEETGASPRQRVNATGFLTARLLDLFLGDRDRHKGQWRWARFPEGDGFRWEAVPEDRDQAFVKHDGVLLWSARAFFVPKLTDFSGRYTNLVGLTWNAWDLDRRFLSALERPVWDSVAGDMQARLTDAVIVDAVRRMPPEYQRLRGDQLTAELVARRDGLRAVAGAYYRLLAEYVDVHGTDADEIAAVDRRDDGTVVVELRVEGEEQPYFRRTFRPEETREIRIYLRGGADSATVVGTGRDVTLRVIGGEGRDRLVDRSAGAVHFYDAGHETVFVRGRGTRVDRREFEAPPSPDFVHEHPPDWGLWVRPAPWASFNPDYGLFLGGGATRYRYGFRKFPYSSRVKARAGFAFGVNRPTAELLWEQREVLPNTHFDLHAEATGLDVIRFHGVGNDVVLDAPGSFYRVVQLQSGVSVGLTLQPTDRLSFRFGPAGRVVATRAREGTFLGLQGADFYGAGTFAKLGFETSLAFDGRNRPVAATKGLSLRLGSSVVGPWLDVDDAYAEVHGEAAAYVTAHGTLALRAGARKVFGRFPFFDAAFVGGSETVRGYAEQRFAGDAAVWGNAELRVPVARVRVIFPGQGGVLGLADVGRVFSDADVPGNATWHSAFGGGLWLSLLNPSNVMSVEVARSVERTAVYVNAGFMF